MTVSMITCPSCRTLLFSDTVVCPACQHILDEERAALISQDDLSKSRSEQVPCRNCGEANQIGLVRCWNCSSFLREDIQEAYYEMLKKHREITYSQPHSFYEARSGSDRFAEEDPAGGAVDEAGGDDFELSDEYRLSPPSPSQSQSQRPTNGSGTKSPQPAAAEKTPREADEPEAEDDPAAEDHSVATGGDVLLDIALKEEQEGGKTRKRRRSGKQKGKPGQAGSPERAAAQKRALAKRQRAEKKKPDPKFGVWLTDIRQHAINPQKLRLKPGSVEKQFALVDVGCSAGGVIIVSLKTKPSLFGRSKTTPAELREEVRDHLEAEKKKEDLPAPTHEFFEPEAVKLFKVVQPVVYVHESMFAGVPVFGEGRIVVCLPPQPDAAEHRFLAFWLSEFRQFSQALEKYFGIKELGILEAVPLTDPILDLQCHYSEEPLKVLDPAVVKFYEADPNFKLELAGRRCEGCQLAISEEARRKEKIGGLKGKSIAKAKCPKCEKKFGTTSLFRIAPPEDKDAAKDSKKDAKKKSSAKSA